MSSRKRVTTVEEKNMLELSSFLPASILIGLFPVDPVCLDILPPYLVFLHSLCGGSNIHPLDRATSWVYDHNIVAGQRWLGVV
jgi:hypothetical protein